MGFHRRRIWMRSTRRGLETSSMPQMRRFEIPLVSSACQKPLRCRRPGYIHGYPTEPPWIGQSCEGSAVKLSLHVAHQCCWEGSRTCSTALE